MPCIFFTVYILMYYFLLFQQEITIHLYPYELFLKNILHAMYIFYDLCLHALF